MDRFRSLTVKDMKNELERLGVSDKGNKQELIDRYEEVPHRIMAVPVARK